MKKNTSTLATAALRRLSKYLLLPGLFLAAALNGAEQKFTVTDRCHVAVGDELLLRIGVLDKNFRFHFLHSDTFKKLNFDRTAKSSELKASLLLPGNSEGTFAQSTKTAPDGGLDYRAEFTFEKPTYVRDLVLAPMELPTRKFMGRMLLIDGERFRLPRLSPESKEQSVLFQADDIETLEFPLRTGGTLVIQGKFGLRIEDQRPYGNANYSLRIRFTPFNGEKVTKSELKLSMKIRE